MASEGYHEPFEMLDAGVIERHRAIRSIMEELEAVDWYDQRVAATNDPSLAAVLAHNRDEEKEHAAMTLEWLRRHAAELKHADFTDDDQRDAALFAAYRGLTPEALAAQGREYELGLYTLMEEEGNE